MASETVTDAAKAQTASGVTKSSTWRCDVFTGSADGLVAAGVITPEQLNPQEGRAPGYTVFLPNGDPCPPLTRAWRESGYKAIRLQEDGTYCVEVTVSKQVQAWRRKAEKAAEHEREQDRINKELAASGHKYINWTLRHDFSGSCETWDGTKAQLQAIGLGVGLKFPGEPGGPKKDLRCKCPLGFDVVIFQPGYDHALAAAGIYRAVSHYVQDVQEEEQPRRYVTHAPGVLLWQRRHLDRDTYVGTAQALVDAKLVASLAHFPGQPGRNKVQASYRKDWSPSTTSSGQTWGATIHKQGNSGRFSVEIPVTKQEFERRKALRKAREEERKATELRMSAERKQLRESADPAKSADEFRAERAKLAELYIDLLWISVFDKADGPLRFDIPNEYQLRDDLADAFQTIRDAVQAADIHRDKKQEFAAQARRKLAAARNDKGLQSLLHHAKHLRLVHSSSSPTRPAE